MANTNGDERGSDVSKRLRGNRHAGKIPEGVHEIIEDMAKTERARDEVDGLRERVEKLEGALLTMQGERDWYRRQLSKAELMPDGTWIARWGSDPMFRPIGTMP